MDWETVDSSRIKAICWKDNTTYIMFPDGSIYSYSDVSFDQHTDFANSASLGRELQNFQRLHPYRKEN